MLGLKLIHISKRGPWSYHFYTVMKHKMRTNWMFWWNFHTLCNFEDVPLQLQLPSSKSALLIVMNITS